MIVPAVPGSSAAEGAFEPSRYPFDVSIFKSAFIVLLRSEAFVAFPTVTVAIAMLNLLCVNFRASAAQYQYEFVGAPSTASINKLSTWSSSLERIMPIVAPAEFILFVFDMAALYTPSL